MNSTSEPTPVVRLVRPRVWRRVLREQLAHLQQGDAEWAMSILVNLHSQHIGLTPHLAAGLAQMLYASKKTTPPPWPLLTARLIEALRALSERQDAMPVTLLPNAAAPYVVYKIVAPLVDAICRRHLHELVLFSEDAQAQRSLSYRRYNMYAQALQTALEQALADKLAVVPRAFWEDRATMLMNISRRYLDEDVNPMPETDLRHTSLFLHLRHKGLNQRDEQQRRVQIQQPLRLRDERMRESGFDGIAMTTGPEQLAHRLTTEYVYPWVMQLDRIFNSGYMVLKPPPPPVRLRDVLIVGMAPASLYQHPAQVFLKTTWFDFTMHMTNILRANRMSRSEFRWIEADNLHRMRVQNVLLEAIDYLPLATSHDFTRHYRQLYIQALGWLPGFLDANARYTALPGTPSNEVARGSRVNSTTAWWLRQAWRQQTDDATWTEKRRGQVRTRQQVHRAQRELRLSEFRFVHVMLFLPHALAAEPPTMQAGAPAAPRYPDGALGVEQLASLLGVSQQHIGITWVPGDIAQATEWAYTGRAQLATTGWADDDGLVTDLSALSGALIDVWLRAIMKEMQRG